MHSALKIICVMEELGSDEDLFITQNTFIEENLD
jgi:hypothetical protein